jgi:hypothetical protein
MVFVSTQESKIIHIFNKNDQAKKIVLKLKSYLIIWVELITGSITGALHKEHFAALGTVGEHFVQLWTVPVS